MSGKKVPTLYYFDTRGFAEPIRLLLADAGVTYHYEGCGLRNGDVYPQAFLDLRATGVCVSPFF